MLKMRREVSLIQLQRKDYNVSFRESINQSYLYLNLSAGITDSILKFRYLTQITLFTSRYIIMLSV